MLDLKKQELPHLIRVRQHFPTDCISDIPAAVRQELDKLTLDDKLRDKQIAITAGSRGIANIATISAASLTMSKRREVIHLLSLPWEAMVVRQPRGRLTY